MKMKKTIMASNPGTIWTSRRMDSPPRVVLVEKPCLLI